MGKHGNVPQFGGGGNLIQRTEQRLRAEFDAKERFITDFLLQVGCDAFLIAAADVFQLGQGRAEKAIRAYKSTVMEMMERIVDFKGKDMDYYWDTLDRRIRQIVGDRNFAPREKRYDETGMAVFCELFIRTAKAIKEANLAGKDGGTG